MLDSDILADGNLEDPVRIKHCHIESWIDMLSIMIMSIKLWLYSNGSNVKLLQNRIMVYENGLIYGPERCQNTGQCLSKGYDSLSSQWISWMHPSTQLSHKPHDYWFRGCRYSM